MKITRSEIRNMIKKHKIVDYKKAQIWLDEKKRKVAGCNNLSCDNRFCFEDYQQQDHCFHAAINQDIINQIKISEVLYLLDIVATQSRYFSGDLDKIEIEKYYKPIKKAYSKFKV